MHYGADVEAITATLNRDRDTNPTNSKKNTSSCSISEKPSSSSSSQSNQNTVIYRTPSARTPSARKNNKINIGKLLSMLLPQLDKDRTMQFQTLYNKLTKAEICRDEFTRHMSSIVGAQMLKQVLSKIRIQQAAENSQTVSHQLQTQSQTLQQQQQVKMPSHSTSQFADSNPFSQLHQKGHRDPTDPTQVPAVAIEVKSDSSFTATKSNAQKRESEHRPDSHSQGMHANHVFSTNLVNQERDLPTIQGPTKTMSSTSVENCERHKSKVGGSLASMTPGQTQEQRSSQFSSSSSSTSFSSGKNDQGNPVAPGSNSTPVSMPAQLDSPMPVRTQVPYSTTLVGQGTNLKNPLKKPSIGQKKPLDVIGTPSSLASKKQKVSGAFQDQSIDQLNDVTAVSGVNLTEEEEQLFSGHKEESRASEATRRVIQEEEERLMMQKSLFQKKLAAIMLGCGIKNASKDVERCLSLCLEERMRGLISNSIRVSKQRVDIERSRHQTIVTSDVRHQILIMNRKAKEDWEKKQAEEAEKLWKLNEDDGNTGADSEMDKDEGRKKALKANKEEDDKMRTTAANVAARVAVGGDDMISKWQLMAEQARQKRKGVDSSVGQIDKDITHKPSSTSGRTSRETYDDESSDPSSASTPGTMRKLGRNPVIMPHTKVVRTISVKDVIAVLEREPQMSNSTLVYRLWDEVLADAPKT